MPCEEYAFASWFQWPIELGDRHWQADDETKSALAETWILKTEEEFWRVWAYGVECGRIFPVI
jgi:hypothetical protein